MGSLTSSPDLPPPQPRPKVIKQPAPQPENGGDSTPPESGTHDTPETPEKADQADSGGNRGDEAEQEQQRAASLLRERRGRESTINTGFRGILEPRQPQPRRKTLLGG